MTDPDDHDQTDHDADATNRGVSAQEPAEGADSEPEPGSPQG